MDVFSFEFVLLLRGHKAIGVLPSQNRESCTTTTATCQAHSPACERKDKRHSSLQGHDIPQCGCAFTLFAEFFFVDTFPKMPSHPQEESHVYLAEGSSASLELSEVATTSDQLVLVAGWNEESSQNGLWF